jgi:hypothetical protein
MFKIFAEITGWRRALVEPLQIVMYFGLLLAMGRAVDNFLLSARAGHPEPVWHFVVIALVATILIAWITRSVSFVWPTFLFAISIVFMIQSFRLFEGEEFPEHRTLDALAGVGCIAIYFILFRLLQRSVERGKRTSSPTKVTAE